MTDLDEKEQQHVRTALQYLRRRVGAWKPLADALGFQYDTVEKVANARGRNVTASMAIRVARLAGVGVDDLLSGKYIPGACSRCGYRPDFGDEETVVESPPLPPDGLKLVKP